MLTKIKKLDVNAGAIIELVQDEKGVTRILKTCDVYEVKIETAFIKLLKEHGIPCVEVFQNGNLQDNQLLLEYVEGSPTLGKQEVPELFRKWGAVTRKMHDTTSQKAMKLLETGQMEEINWADFLKGRYMNADTKGLDQERVQKIVKALDKLFATEISEFSLIHGDLHSNNVFVRDGEILLFDKGHYVFYGDKYYDLAIFMINFGFDEADKEIRDAFIEGYGYNFIEQEKERVELNTLLRAFERHGNRFEPQTGEIIEKLSEKYFR